MLDELLRKLLGLRGPNDHYRRIEHILMAQLRLLIRIEKALTKPEEPARFLEIFEIINGQEQRIEGMKLLSVEKKLKLAVKGFKDKKGNEAPVDGMPVWSMSDEKFGTLEVAADGMSAIFAPGGVAHLKGEVALKIYAQADADMGEGMKPIVGFIEVQLLGLEAVAVEMEAEEVVEAPAPVAEPVVEAPAPVEEAVVEPVIAEPTI